MTNIKKKYWYKTTFDHCPACGKNSIYKERVYGQKPQKIEERHTTTETYDYCIEYGRI
jgi:hypothetical protein